MNQKPREVFVKDAVCPGCKKPLAVAGVYKVADTGKRKFFCTCNSEVTHLIEDEDKKE